VNDAELAAFLARALTAVISTVGRDGTPRGTPVWFLYEDGRVLIWTGAGRGWVRNLARAPQVAITVAEHEPPFAAVVLRGTGVVHQDRPDTAAIIRRLTEKYIPAPDVDAYIARYAALTTIVEVSVTSARSWGRGY
jgi:PPOX class probable F420-dependent enzyme